MKFFKSMIVVVIAVWATCLATQPQKDAQASADYQLAVCRARLVRTTADFRLSMQMRGLIQSAVTQALVQNKASSALSAEFKVAAKIQEKDLYQSDDDYLDSEDEDFLETLTKDAPVHYTTGHTEATGQVCPCCKKRKQDEAEPVAPKKKRKIEVQESDLDSDFGSSSDDDIDGLPFLERSE